MLQMRRCLRKAGRDRLSAWRTRSTWEDIGAIVVATGYDHFDPSVMSEYGYGQFPNVITTMEMERLNNSAGPTAGDLIRPSDLKNPKRLAFINCVGSRDKRYNPYCSNFCCMYSIKNAVLLKQRILTWISAFLTWISARPPRAMKSSMTGRGNWAFTSSRDGRA